MSRFRSLAFGLALAGLWPILAGCGNDSLAPQAATPSAPGLVTQDLLVGTGPYPLAGQTVSISYTATLPNGTKVDSTVDRGQNFTFVLGSGTVIQGLELAITSMKVGGHRKVTIPPNLAYGAAGSPPSIPPNATLIYDLWLASAS